MEKTTLQRQQDELDRISNQIADEDKDALIEKQDEVINGYKEVIKLQKEVIDDQD